MGITQLLYSDRRVALAATPEAGVGDSVTSIDASVKLADKWANKTILFHPNFLDYSSHTFTK